MLPRPTCSSCWRGAHAHGRVLARRLCRPVRSCCGRGVWRAAQARCARCTVRCCAAAPHVHTRTLTWTHPRTHARSHAHARRQERAPQGRGGGAVQGGAERVRGAERQARARVVGGGVQSCVWGRDRTWSRCNQVHRDQVLQSKELTQTHIRTHTLACRYDSHRDQILRSGERHQAGGGGGGEGGPQVNARVGLAARGPGLLRLMAPRAHDDGDHAFCTHRMRRSARPMRRTCSAISRAPRTRGMGTGPRWDCVGWV